MAYPNIIRIRSISQFHELRGLPEPAHPLVSIVKVEDFTYPEKDTDSQFIMDYYSISLKRNCGAIRYGHQPYDYNTGVMYFVAPGQIFTVKHERNRPEPSGWMLLFHPDFIWNTALAENIHHYDYFGYEVNEALWVSDKEEAIIIDFLKNMQTENQINMDKFSKQIIISQIESLLNYAERFYHRQFITREKSNHQILTRLASFLEQYFESSQLTLLGPPRVADIATHLNPSCAL